jgi:signal peptidase I
MKNLKRVVFVLAALIVAYHAVGGILYLCGFRIYRIPTSAMEPTIRKNEMVIGRLSESYKRQVERLDIAIYRLPQAPGEIYAKRVAALAGEHVVIGNEGVSVGGKKVALPHPVTPAGRGALDVRVPAGSVFLVGDNTSNSMDSRYHGPVPTNDILGYLVFKR